MACEAGKKVLPFLTNLAKQRGLVISSTAGGALLFHRSVEVGTPVARLTQGASPVLSVVPNFAPQEYYSHITGLEPALVGIPGAKYTVQNPHLSGALRPLTFKAPDTLDSDVKAAVEAKVGRMFGAMVSYTVKLSTLRDPSGKLWQPNTTLELEAPDAMIYSPYEFIIRSEERRVGKECRL